MNCELHDTPGGMTNSHDVFAVVKRLFGSARRVEIRLDAQTATTLNALARRHMQTVGKKLLVIDLLIHRDGRHQLFVDAGSPRRLGDSGDDFFKSKRVDYVALAPPDAAGVERAGRGLRGVHRRGRFGRLEQGSA